MFYTKLSAVSDEISSNIYVQFKTLNKLGIPYFEPRGIDGKNISELDDSEVMALREKMLQYNIQASSIGSPVGKIKIAEDFEPHFEMFKHVVRIAKMLHAKYIRMFSFYHDGEEWTDTERDEVFCRLRKLISYAKEQDIVLLHENEKDIYGDTIEHCLELMREFHCEHFKAVFDPANFVQCGQDTIQAFETLEPYIAYIHIKDACNDARVVPAGEGEGNIEYLLRELLKKGYHGFISLEPHLGSFEGLAALETDDSMTKLPEGGEGTFTLAYHALQDIMNRIGETKYE